MADTMLPKMLMVVLLGAKLPPTRNCGCRNASAPWTLHGVLASRT
jgi:hypothetical protein